MKRMKIVVLILVTAMAGCHTVTSQKYDGSGSQEGVAYALPIQLVQIHAWAGPDKIKLAQIEKDLKAKEGALKGIDKAINDLDKAIAKAKDDSAKAPHLKKKAAATAEKKKVVGQIAKLATASAEAQEPKHRLTVETLPAVADPNAIYVADGFHNWLRDDDLDIALSGAGKGEQAAPLLASVNVTAADRTGEVLLNVAKAYFSWSTGIPSGDAAADLVAGERRPDSDKKKFYDVIVVLNPADPQSTTKAETNLQTGTTGVFAETGYALSVVDALDNPIAAASTAASPAGPANGVFYRQSKGYVIKISNGMGLRREVQVNVPNAGPVAVLPFDSGTFVTTTYAAKFQGGQLVDVDSTRPSEIENLTQLPLRLFEDLSSAVTGAVSDVVSVNLDTSDAPAVDQDDASASSDVAPTGSN